MLTNLTTKREVAHYLNFRLGSQWYGLDVKNVIEVLHFVKLTELPNTGESLLGLMTLREHVLSVLDMRRLFNLTDVSFQLNTPIVAARSSKGMIGLVVDEVDQVATVNTDQLIAYKGPYVSQISSVARIGESLLLIIDPSILDKYVNVQT